MEGTRLVACRAVAFVYRVTRLFAESLDVDRVRVRVRGGGG